jgi:hypothetical protein
MEIQVDFNFIYTMCYNGLVFFYIFFFDYQHCTSIEASTFNMLKSYLRVAFYIYHNLLKHIQQLKTPCLY